MFKANQQFVKLKSNNPESAEYLTAEIRERAQGVFLWVYLVVRSLLRGLTNEDDMLDLNRRLLQIPVELEDIFRRMLDNIDPIYWQRAACLLQLVKYASGPILFLTILYFDLDEKRKSTRPSLSLGNWPYLDPTTAELLRVKKRQITAQCKDLLHITASPDLPAPLSEKLGPLHRTVVDFLKTDAIDKLLVQRAGPDFEPWTMLFNATTKQIKALVPMSRLVHISRVLPSWFSDAIRYAQRMELNNTHTEVESLNNLEKVLARYSQSRKWTLEYCLSNVLGEADCRCLLDLAVKHDLTLYAKQKVQSCSEYERTLLLECALGRRPCAGIEPTTARKGAVLKKQEVIDHLRAMGISPTPDMISRGFTISVHRSSASSRENRAPFNDTDGTTEVVRRKRKHEMSVWGFMSRIFR
ncbi:hypothetical protein EDB81DRAFT_923865 [Dactylonectria macrodidyma]|uniref:DUF7791 domain-containing protein n=1 Tax=Dactylonectria macrodidyma TaxID=307937 RepID=A0A9P9FF70_9HYPO|nr:hypothetical protein EDB81DRAFT_923865 [Dactylonectria macrodidyma]